jgi:hypothetical protein
MPCIKSKTKYLANSTLSMPIREYSKPLEANEFGAYRAVGLAVFRPNE